MKKYILRMPIMLSIALSPLAYSGTTTLTQTIHKCNIFDCNTSLQDGESFSYNIATSAYYGPSQLTFRGQTYYDLTWTCGISKCPSGDTSQTITANHGQYVVHETFQRSCFITCVSTNLSGSFTLHDDVFSIRPTAFGGSSGYPYYGPGPLTGTGQVEHAVKSLTDTIVRLKSSDPSITVPETAMITAGLFPPVVHFAVKAVGIKNGNPATTGMITATFPDGYAVHVTVTDNPLPPPPDN